MPAGGILITIGNATSISGNAHVFIVGLLINVFGVRLLKPMSVQWSRSSNRKEARGCRSCCLLIAAVLVVVVLAPSGTIKLDPNAISRACSVMIGLLALGYFGYLLFFAGLAPEDRHRV